MGTDTSTTSLYVLLTGNVVGIWFLKNRSILFILLNRRLKMPVRTSTGGGQKGRNLNSTGDTALINREMGCAIPQVSLSAVHSSSLSKSTSSFVPDTLPTTMRGIGRALLCDRHKGFPRVISAVCHFSPKCQL